MKFSKNCEVCKASFRTHVRSQKFCSKKCRDEYNSDWIAPTDQNVRFAIMARDKFKCFYCGRGSVDGAVLEIDHIWPSSKRGEDVLYNLVTSCEKCNKTKTDKLFNLEIMSTIWDMVFKRTNENKEFLEFYKKWRKDKD